MTAASEKTSRARILVVDDDYMQRMLTMEFLETSGFAVEEATSGAESLEIIHESVPDLVIMDVVMPGANGLQVLREIRQTYSRSELPVVMLTGRDENSDIVEALRNGANEYLTKPLVFDVALARINTQLAHKADQEAIKDSEERYALAVAGSNDGLWDWDLRHDRIFFSPRWKELMGYDDQELMNQIDTWFGRIHPLDVERVRREITSHIEGISLSFRAEYRMRHKSNAYRWVLTRGTSLRGVDGRSYRFAGSHSDITDSKVKDALTGLPNRTLLVDRLEQALSRLKRRGEYRFGLALLSVDHFDAIKESFGQAYCDLLIGSVANRLLIGTRPSDSIAMIGENLFGLMIDDVKDALSANAVVTRLKDELRQPLKLEQEEFITTLSAGITMSYTNYSAAEDMLRDATVALSKAKEFGGTRTEIFDPEMHEKALGRLRLEADLRKALERGEFVVHYQPINSLEDRRIAGFEALIRWNHPDRGVVQPDEFIPLAENTGLIVEIGKFVLQEAAEQLAAWSTLWPASNQVFMSVNVSPKQLENMDFVDTVAAVLERTGIDPSVLKLEITETAIMNNVDLALKILNALVELGIGLELDDFGTGHSSLSLLQMIPVTTLKLDRSFIMKMPEGDEAVQMIQMIVNLAHSLSMDVIAEGIEDELAASRLAEMECEFAQGFFFAKPLPAGDVDIMSLLEVGNDADLKVATG